MKKSYVIIMIMNPFVQSPIVLAIIIWSVVLKGLALWRAAQSKQKNWFIVLVLPLNTAGILELIYLVKFAKKPLTLDEVRSWIKKFSEKK